MVPVKTTKRATQARYVVSVLVADRVGILRDISSAITDTGGNIDSLSQTVVEGYFTVILTATFRGAVKEESVRRSIMRNFEQAEAMVVVREYLPPVGPASPRRGERYMLTMTGKDRPGTVHLVTACLAERGINIEDWFMSMKGPIATYVGEVTVPPALDVKQVRDELMQLLGKRGLRVSLQHENIFRATSEVGPVLRLIRGVL